MDLDPTYFSCLINISSQSLKSDNLLGVWKLATNAKFQHNISKNMPARQKNTCTWGVNNHMLFSIM